MKTKSTKDNFLFIGGILLICLLCAALLLKGKVEPDVEKLLIRVYLILFVPFMLFILFGYQKPVIKR